MPYQTEIYSSEGGKYLDAVCSSLSPGNTNPRASNLASLNAGFLWSKTHRGHREGAYLDPYTASAEKPMLSAREVIKVSLSLFFFHTH